MGYPIIVYQTERMDFCSEELGVVDVCNEFSIPNLKTIHSGVDDMWTRAEVLIKTLIGQSMMITKIQMQRMKMYSWGVSTYDERMLPRLASDVEINPANFYFAHILLPHPPIVYRQDCSLYYGSEAWLRFPSTVGLIGNTLESRRERYGKWVPQAQCALHELGALFNTLKDKGLYDEATIVVHGDHGTSAYVYAPSVSNVDNITYRDLREMYSALFAVKYPGGSFSVNDEITSLNVLMAQTISEITGKSPEELGISVVSEDEPFIYLNDSEPMKRMYVNIFKRIEPEFSATD
jgi:hypothetical protein